MAEEKKPEIPMHRERLNLPDKEEQQKLSEKKRKQLSADLKICFGSVEGRRVLRYLANITGYGKNKLGGNPQIGLDFLHGVVYNATREQVFLELIEFLPAYILKDTLFGNIDDIEL